MTAQARAARSSEKDWWLRALLVLQSPRPVFAALRSTSDEAARQEPLTAIVLLAGVAGVLASPVAGRLLDDPALDGVLVAVWAFLGGGVYGIAVYWVAGALVHGASRALGAGATYRTARHLVGFALAPAALSLLLLWPVRVAVYGEDLFERGGADAGTGGAIFSWLAIAFFAWAVVLLAVGVRTVHRWTWLRSLAAVALAAAPLAVLALLNELAPELVKLASSSSGIA